MAVTKGEREQDPSLLVTEGDRLLTFGEETEGVGFSPGVKKPLAVAKGKGEGGFREATWIDIPPH